MKKFVVIVMAMVMVIGSFCAINWNKDEVAKTEDGWYNPETNLGYNDDDGYYTIMNLVGYDEETGEMKLADDYTMRLTHMSDETLSSILTGEWC